MCFLHSIRVHALRAHRSGHNMLIFFSWGEKMAEGGEVVDNNQIGILESSQFNWQMPPSPLRCKSENAWRAAGFWFCLTENKPKVSEINWKVLDYVQNSARHQMDYPNHFLSWIVF